MKNVNLVIECMAGCGMSCFPSEKGSLEAMVGNVEVIDPVDEYRTMGIIIGQAGPGREVFLHSLELKSRSAK